MNKPYSSSLANSLQRKHQPTATMKSAHLTNFAKPRAYAIQVGEVLLKAGVLKQADLVDAIDIAKSIGRPLDKVLVTSGFVTERQMLSALKACDLLSNDMIVEEVALKGLALACQRGLAYEEALRYFGWGW